MDECRIGSCLACRHGISNGRRNVQAKQKKVLVAYFSATVTTKSAALKIKKAAKGAKVQSGADLTDSSAAGVAKWAKKKVK